MAVLTVVIMAQHLVVIGTAAADVQDSIDYIAAAVQVTIAVHAFIPTLLTAADTVLGGQELVLDN